VSPEDALIKIYLPLKFGDVERSKASPQEAEKEPTIVTDSPVVVESTSSRKRKTYAAFMQEIEQCNETIRRTKKELSACQRSLKECKVKHSKARASIEVELDRRKRLLEKREKQMKQLTKQLQDGKTKHQELQSRFTELKTMVQVEGLFNNTDLDFRSINHMLRGQDEGHTINLLTRSLALRNEQYNKLSQRKEDLERGDNEKIEGLEMNNKKLREKIKRQSESIKKLKDVEDRYIKTTAANTAAGGLKDPQQEKVYQSPEGPVDKERIPKQKDDTTTPTTAAERSTAALASPGPRAYRPPSFIKHKRPSQPPPSLISEGHDGFGGKRKILHSMMMNTNNSRLNRDDNRQKLNPKTAFQAKAKPTKIAKQNHRSNRSGGISLSKPRLGVVDLTRHGNLNMEHYFDRA
jgi:hypothetical protein